MECQTEQYEARLKGHQSAVTSVTSKRRINNRWHSTLSKTVRLVNMPHYMFYAPNLTSKELGGGPVTGPYPYLVNSGPHAYLIVNVGETEKAQINKEERNLLQDLCAYRSYFCAKEAAANAPEH